ncbi:DNA gyrase subunit A [Candidatus Berkelbacteria bacterium]|nr:DNA gyrase subunit A [Candidatus Berkelbacteria bacterium]
MTEFGRIAPRILEREMEESYLDYAMSVIVSRALPDVRDGLKPVHRRVLYAMHDLGLRSTAKHRKSATVVGEVLGKYHPHGDVAVYDTLVRMAQTFAMRYPLVDGQGNFGSVDGDSAAAMRYTEAKMAPLAEELLADIEKDTVNFIPNFDGSREEPTVLPAKVPNLLLNGALGIAVGMATNIPPHNLAEVVAATIHLLANEDATIEELMEFVKGPDFPTGGMIFDQEEIRAAYTTGKGKIVMRGEAEILEADRGYQIVITSLPYQVNKADLVTKMAELVKLKKLEGISDIRDESDREAGVRVAIDLKQTAFPKKILNQLYAMTPLESAFHVNLLALVDGIQPRVLTLKQVLEEYIKHRITVVRRRTAFDLMRAKERAHVLEGLKIALDHIDAVIATIRASKNREDAHQNLRATFELTDIQATAILEMRLAALAALERQKIDDELKEKLQLIADLEAILASEAKIKAIIKDELTAVAERFNEPRRTKVITQAIGGFRAEDLIPNEQVIVTLTGGGYIKRVPVATYRSQHRGGKGIVGMQTKEEDVVEHLLTTWTHNDVLFFTDRGRLFVAKVYDLPSTSRTAKGQAMPNIIQIAPDERVTSVITLDKITRQQGTYVFMGTERGIVKKTLIGAYATVRKTGMIAIKLRDTDVLRWVSLTTGDDRIMLVSHAGQAICFSEKDVRPMGRSASGVTGMRLRSADKVMAMVVIPARLEAEVGEKKRGRPAIAPMLMTVLQNGFGKRTSIDEFRGQRRGGLGVRAARVTEKVGKVVAARVTIGDHGDVVLVSQHGVTIRLPLRSVKKLGRDTQGVTLMRLKSGDRVASVTVIVKDENDLDDETGLPPTIPAAFSPPTAPVDEGGPAPAPSRAAAEDGNASLAETQAGDHALPTDSPGKAKGAELAKQTPAVKKSRPVSQRTAAAPLRKPPRPTADEPNYWGRGGLWNK